MATWRDKWKIKRPVGTCAECKQHKPILIEGWNLCHLCWLAHFNCLRCGINTRVIDEYYTLKNEIWLAANPKNDGMMCIGCVEDVLRRQLTRDDFRVELPINDLNDPDWPKSDRLVNRLLSFRIIQLTEPHLDCIIHR